MKDDGAIKRVPYPEIQGASPTAIPTLESTAAKHSFAAAVTESTARCGAWIITFPGCATLLPRVAASLRAALTCVTPTAVDQRLLL